MSQFLFSKLRAFAFKILCIITNIVILKQDRPLNVWSKITSNNFIPVYFEKLHPR